MRYFLISMTIVFWSMAALREDGAMGISGTICFSTLALTYYL